MLTCRAMNGRTIIRMTFRLLMIRQLGVINEKTSIVCLRNLVHQRCLTWEAIADGTLNWLLVEEQRSSPLI